MRTLIHSVLGFDRSLIVVLCMLVLPPACGAVVNFPISFFCSCVCCTHTWLTQQAKVWLQMIPYLWHSHQHSMSLIALVFFASCIFPRSFCCLCVCCALCVQQGSICHSHQQAKVWLRYLSVELWQSNQNSMPLMVFFRLLVCPTVSQW